MQRARLMGIFDLALLYNVEKLKGIVLLSVQMCLCAVKVLYTERKKNIFEIRCTVARVCI